MWSLTQIFRIGLGPSSSHCIGPMRAALHFISQLNMPDIESIEVALYGSLAYTCHGHGTDKAIVSGLSGHQPHTIDVATAQSLVEAAQEGVMLTVPQTGQQVMFCFAKHLHLRLGENIGTHSNGMRFSAIVSGQVQHQASYFSVGGGFVEDEAGGMVRLVKEPTLVASDDIPHPFDSYAELRALCVRANCSIAELMLANECAFHQVDATVMQQRLQALIDVMLASVARGLDTEGILPGGLGVERRAASLYQASQAANARDGFLDRLNAYAMAVNEENAYGGQVVTAPTNGASGILPAVLRHHLEQDEAQKDDALTFLLTAGAIAMLYKKNASISGADVGCQGEVGVASSMAAGALAAVRGGTLSEIEIASEIAMEHHLGMTCDPVKGLVQIPCIERNAMGALKAVNAARMALIGEHHPKVSLDQVIETMMQTGQNMHDMFKETSLGGLAVHVVEC